MSRRYREEQRKKIERLRREEEKRRFQELEQQTENYSKIIKIRKYVAYAKNEIS